MSCPNFFGSWSEPNGATSPQALGCWRVRSRQQLLDESAPQMPGCCGS
jgi:hypothetical protein